MSEANKQEQSVSVGSMNTNAVQQDFRFAAQQGEDVLRQRYAAVVQVGPDESPGGFHLVTAPAGKKAHASMLQYAFFAAPCNMQCKRGDRNYTSYESSIRDRLGFRHQLNAGADC
jgi:hypothetical protein